MFFLAGLEYDLSTIAISGDYRPRQHVQFLGICLLFKLIPLFEIYVDPGVFLAGCLFPLNVLRLCAAI